MPPTPGAVQAAVEKTVSAFGRLDVLVNNAGTAIPKKFEETTLEEFDQVINLNIRSVFVTTQAALKQMNNDGRIISIGSCVGERMMTPGLVPYSATKSAIRMFTQGLSREVGDRGITVNNVQPGPIDTDLNPASGRLGDTAKGGDSALSLRQGGRSRGACRFRGQPRGILHHWRKPDGGWRHKRLTRGLGPIKSVPISETNLKHSGVEARSGR